MESVGVPIDMWLLLQGSEGTLVLFASIFMLVAILLILGRSKEKVSTPREKVLENGHTQMKEVRGPTTAQVNQLFRSMGVEDTPHEEGTAIPSHGLVTSNSEEPAPFSNEFCDGVFLSMHRATHDRQLDKSCAYRNGEYFRDRTRKWEARAQLRFKKPAKQEDIFFGVEINDFYPMNALAKRTRAVVVRALKSVVGDQIYVSDGDDPKKIDGEAEWRIFGMPLMAMDQFIVTPEGEEPPDIQDPNLGSMGCCRYQRIREYRKEIEQLELKVGPTYTFCFWCISRFLDKLNWQITLPMSPRPISIDIFCGAPPIRLVMYTLNESKDGEQRHLQSRKNYIINIAFWSSKHRPSWGRLNELLGARGARGATLEDWPSSGDPETWDCLKDSDGRRLEMIPNSPSKDSKGKLRKDSWLTCCTVR